MPVMLCDAPSQPLLKVRSMSQLVLTKRPPARYVSRSAIPRQSLSLLPALPRAKLPVLAVPPLMKAVQEQRGLPVYQPFERSTVCASASVLEIVGTAMSSDAPIATIASNFFIFMCVPPRYNFGPGMYYYRERPHTRHPCVRQKVSLASDDFAATLRG